jgi:hypothetical protein
VTGRSVNSGGACSNLIEHEDDALHPASKPRSARRRMSLHEQLAEMPDWPILMNAATAALYLEISPASFHALVRRAGVRPVDMGMGLVRWRRRDLDDLVTALPARQTSQEQPPPGADFNAALERSARRAGQGRGQTRRADP